MHWTNKYLSTPRGQAMLCWGVEQRQDGPLPALCGLPADPLAQATDLDSWQSPDSPGLKNKPRCCPGPKSKGPQAPRAEAGEAAGRTISLERGSSHQHGAPASLLKDRLERSLKDANTAADIWEILAGDQTRAETSELPGRRWWWWWWGGVVTRQQGPGLVGDPEPQGLGLRLCIPSSPVRPRLGILLSPCRKDSGTQKARTWRDNG